MNRLRIIVLVVLCSVLAMQSSWAAGPVKRVKIMEIDVGSTIDAYASVLDEDRAHMPGLDASAFEVHEDNALVDVQVAEERAGIAVMVMVDLSGSMTETGVAAGQTRMASTKEVAIQFIEEHLAPEDRVGVIGFHIETVGNQELTLDHGAARNTVFELEAELGKNTALLNTASQALDTLHETPLGKMRKILLIFSDGKDHLEKQDPVRYREFREAVARKGRDYEIPIFVVGVGSHCGNNARCVRSFPENEYNFEDVDWLADQTDGRSYHYTTADERAELGGFFSRLASQSMQYHLRYDTHAAKGDHHLKVRASAEGVWAEDEQVFATPFELPTLDLQGPAPDAEVQTETRTVNWEVIPTFPDGWERGLTRVTFFVDDKAVYTNTVATAPYTFTWSVDGYTRQEQPVIWAEAEDAILRQTVSTDRVKVNIQPPWAQLALNWLVDHSVALGVGLLSVILFIILLRKRQVVAQVVGQAATQIKAATTQLLGGQRPLARLKVVQGTHPGRVYNLTNQNAYIGREGCDVILEEGLTISRQHAFIGLHGTQWYIYDLGKPNGIWVDSIRLNPNASVYLRSGSRIRMGDVEFEFLIVGGTTQILSPTP